MSTPAANLSNLTMRPAVRSLAEREQFLAETAHESCTPLATLHLVADSRDPAEVQDRLTQATHGQLKLAKNLSQRIMSTFPDGTDETRRRTIGPPRTAIRRT